MVDVQESWPFIVAPEVKVGASKSIAYCAYATEDTKNAADNSVKREELFIMVELHVLDIERASQTDGICFLRTRM